MRYQFHRIQRKPVIVGNPYKWEKVTDEQVIETFGKDSGVIPQRLAATIMKNFKQTGNWYCARSYMWKVEEVPE